MDLLLKAWNPLLHIRTPFFFFMVSCGQCDRCEHTSTPNKWIPVIIRRKVDSSGFSATMDKAAAVKASATCFSADSIYQAYRGFFVGSFSFYSESLYLHKYKGFLCTENYQTIILLEILCTLINNHSGLFLQCTGNACMMFCWDWWLYTKMFEIWFYSCIIDWLIFKCKETVPTCHC